MPHLDTCSVMRPGWEEELRESRPPTRRPWSSRRGHGEASTYFDADLIGRPRSAPRRAPADVNALPTPRARHTALRTTSRPRRRAEDARRATTQQHECARFESPGTAQNDTRGGGRRVEACIITLRWLNDPDVAYASISLCQGRRRHARRSPRGEGRDDARGPIERTARRVLGRGTRSRGRIERRPYKDARAAPPNGTAAAGLH